jgi:hypothetical protein
VLWAATPLARRFDLDGHGAAVADAQFSPDSSRLHTIGIDGSLLTWDATGRTGLARPVPAAAPEPGYVRLLDNQVVAPLTARV